MPRRWRMRRSGGVRCARQKARRLGVTRTSSAAWITSGAASIPWRNFPVNAIVKSVRSIKLCVRSSISMKLNLNVIRLYLGAPASLCGYSGRLGKQLGAALPHGGVEALPAVDPADFAGGGANFDVVVAAG